MRVNAIVNSVKYLEAWPDSKRTFLPNGRPPQPGDVFRQADLARTLRAMADAEKHAAAAAAPIATSPSTPSAISSTAARSLTASTHSPKLTAA